MFDANALEWPPPPLIAPPEEVIDCLVEDWPDAVEPVRWSEYVADGLLADLLAASAETVRLIASTRRFLPSVTVVPLI
ncbi:MAG TPA: hypothetical protein VNA67_10100 [Pseudonocardiaceae bacterium]|nr:hypothetical protein [Pseudonocardiaceae bacterium]